MQRSWDGTRSGVLKKEHVGVCGWSRVGEGRRRRRGGQGVMGQVRQSLGGHEVDLGFYPRRVVARGGWREKCHLVSAWSMNPRGAGGALGGARVEAGDGILVRDDGSLDQGGGVAEK